MAAWPGPLEAITLFAEDLATTRAFYQEVFGLPVTFEDKTSVVFLFGATAINLLDAGEAPELIGPHAVASPAAGARFQVTLGVDDVDAMCVELRGRGVTLINGPMDRPWGIRTAMFADPAGHLWEIGAKI